MPKIRNLRPIALDKNKTAEEQLRNVSRSLEQLWDIVDELLSDIKVIHKYIDNDTEATIATLVAKINSLHP